jgi:hypothetical protein
MICDIWPASLELRTVPHQPADFEVISIKCENGGAVDAILSRVSIATVDAIAAAFSEAARRMRERSNGL